MRINDLSKEIGKSNRELLSFLEKQGRKAAPMSNVTAEEANLIRDYFKPKNTEASRVDKSKTQQDGAERAEMQGEQPKKKKKFTAVFRPENAQQIRVKNNGNEGAKPQEKAVTEKAAEKTAEKPKENVEKKPETAAPQKKPADSRPPIKTAVSSRLPQGRSAEETRLAIQSRLNALGN
ncbi:MAG: translation initiation factor IF-2 N-terminal domain-containing protein, partial [Stomatobaculum longum]